MHAVTSMFTRRTIAGLALGVAVLAIGAVALAMWNPRRARSALAPAPTGVGHRSGDHDAGEAAGKAAPISLSEAQQRAIGLQVEPVSFGTATDEIGAPGQVQPDETKYAYITPRAAGVVRSVAVHEGQNVRAGELLATIDSPEVAKARFDLYTSLQELDLVQAEAAWEETAYNNTVALLQRLKAGASPDAIHDEFRDRPVGTSREKLITAYAELRLADLTLDRNTDLHKQGLIPAKQFHQVRAETEAARATYKSLTEQMEFDERLAYTRSRQALRKAETAVRVARERLRVLGVRSDGTEPEVKGGRVVGVVPGQGNAPKEPAPEKVNLDPNAILPHGDKPPDPASSRPEGTGAKTAEAAKTEADKPVSTYSIWAPFDGTILDRMMIVPGVYVDTSHRIFTLADLSTVWVEVHVHETNYGQFHRSRDVRLEFTSPAYPGRRFEAEVIYRGDVVEPVSRTLKLLARAQNPDRLLKPGMFVNVAIALPSSRPAALVPAGAVLAEGVRHLVYVQTGPEQFERRRVELGANHGGRTEIVEGLKPGEKVVVRGAFKLKATERQGGAGEPGAGVAGLVTETGR